MPITAAYRNAYRHSLQSVTESAIQCAKRFDTPVLVYRARNGCYMYGRECAYEPRKGDKKIYRVLPSGQVVQL